MSVLYLTGLLCFTLSLFLKDRLPDFWLGYIEGIAITGIIAGVAHFIFCFIEKRNPFNGALNNSKIK